MAVILGLAVGALYAAGTYLLLRRSLVKLILGLALLGHGANLLIFAAGRIQRAAAPILGPDGAPPAPPVADPLPQALILTAIVIGLGVQAFCLVLLKRAYASAGRDDLDTMTSTDAEA